MNPESLHPQVLDQGRMFWPTNQTIAGEHDELQHVRIQSQCGACGGLFNAEDHLVAIVHSEVSIGCCLALNALDFPKATYGKTVGNRLFCRFPHCNRCAAAGETATIHVDCFKLYMSRATLPDKLHRLFSASLGRYSWPESPALLLPPKPEIERASRLAADKYDLKWLTELPNEIKTMIWNLEWENCLLRFSTVLEMVDFLSVADFKKPISAPLLQVQFWQRGSDPIICTGPTQSLIELTIDSRGIRCIERLESSEPKPRSHFIVYTTIRANQRMIINFRYGIGRLSSIPQSVQLQITDVPGLPNMKCFRFPSSQPEIRLSSIDLASCLGITFFISNGKTYAMHAHTRATPFAAATYARIPPMAQTHMIWVYMPNPPGDKISAFGVRLKVDSQNQPISQKHCYLIRTPQRGDLAIGPHLDGPTKDFAVDTLVRSTLVLTIQEFKPTSILGVIPGDSRCLGLSPSPPTGSSRLSDACYASAILQNVACIWVFRIMNTDFCRGLIVVYLDGSQQALGSCRLGVDPAERCTDLTHFAFAPSEDLREGGARPRRIVKVRISPVSNLDAGWTHCSRMHTLEVWVTRTEMVMNVIQTDRICSNLMTTVSYYLNCASALFASH